jgi:dipeptidyl aminopeptidase/acylaminoacyl peptidase
MISRFFAKAAVIHKRMPIVKNPSDYGMAYDDVSFTSDDGVELKAWYIKGASDKLIYFNHPMPFNRYGFHTKKQGLMRISNIEVELLKVVKRLNDAGYSVLTMDMRNHGESGRSHGGVCGVGYHEWQDVAAAMKYTKSSPDLKNKKIGMVVNCMGANSALIALSKEKELFGGIKAVVAIQPVSYDIFLENYVKDKMPFAKPLLPKITKEIKKLSGADPKDMSPLKYIPDIKAPVLYVQVRRDAWTVPDDIISFNDATKSPSKIFWIEGDLERFDGYNYFGEDPKVMLDWLEEYMK